MLDRVRADVRYGWRLLRLTPGVSAAAILTLALGSGATTALYQLFDAAELRALPVHAPGELYEIRLADMTHARGAWLRDNAMTNPLWERIRAEPDVAGRALAWADDTLDISATGEDRKVAALWVSGDFFRVLGVRPALGRLFSDADDQRGCGRGTGVVISDRFWRQEFGADRTIVGRAIPIGRTHAPVLGVTPPAFSGLEVGRGFDVALPICAEPAWKGDARLDSGTVWWLTVMARRPPGLPLDEVRARLRARSAAIFEATLPAGYPAASVKPYLAMTLAVLPASRGLSRLRAAYGQPLGLLFGVSILILFVASINVAHLMLARVDARRREFAVRVALGATGRRLAQQTLVEAMLLVSMAAATGLLVAGALSRVLVSMLAASVPNAVLDVPLGARAFAVSAGIAAVVTLGAGLTAARPAAASKPDGSAIRIGGSTPMRSRATRALLASQVAFSLVLLAATFLFVRTLLNLESVDPGFARDGVVIADVNFSSRATSPDAAAAFRLDLLNRLRALPGVEGAAEALFVPLAGGNWNNRMWLDGSDAAQARVVMRNMVGSGYFRALDIPQIAGRDFTEREIGSAGPPVAIVNAAFLRAFGLDRAVIGRRVSIEGTPQQAGASYEIVGIVGDTKYRDLREADLPIVYVPLWPAAVRRPSGQFVLRSAAASSPLLAESARLTLDALGVRYGLRSYESITRDLLLRERLLAALAGPLGVLGVLLTGLGLYAVFSYGLGRRTREIGVRMALGATAGSVVASVLREALAIVAAGVAVGSVLVPLGAATARALLFGLKPYDAVSLAGSAVAVAAVAAVAAYLPARRAAIVDPAVALRHD